MKRFDIDKFNKILMEFNQETYATVINGKVILLSNGRTIDDVLEVSRCKKRVMDGHDSWKQRFDRIYGLDENDRKIAEQEARADTSRKGGINVQKRYGNKIRKNLNNGVPWNKGTTGLQEAWNKGKTKLNTLSLEKLSEDRKGNGNPMFGTIMSKKGKEHLSNIMKEKILIGEFTPNSNNRNTHWDSYYNDKKYRSSWEAVYQYFDIDAEYEKLRIKYIHEGEEYIYIVDFINHTTKTAIEVKPLELCYNNKKTISKISALKEWCSANNYSLLLVDKKYLLLKGMPKTLSEFDSKTQQRIKILYETN